MCAVQKGNRWKFFHKRRGHLFQAWQVLAVGSDAQFTALCGVLGTDDLTQDDAFAVNAQRVVHRDALAQALNAAARAWQRQDLLVALRDAKVPAGAVHSVAEALSHPAFREAYVHGEPGKEKLRTSAVRVHLSLIHI